MTLSLFALSFALQAASCIGTSAANPAFFSDSTERAAAFDAAVANCCAASVIHWEQISPNVTGSWTIMEHGANSSCNDQ